MIAVQEFTSADDLMAHYAALNERLRGPKKPPPAVVLPFPASTPVPIVRAVVAVPEPSSKTLYPWPIGPRPSRDILWICRPTSTQIMMEVCEKHGVRMLDLKSARRTQNLVLPRQEICYRLRMETGLSFPQMGKLLNRDHSTCIHGSQRYAERLARGEVTP